MSPVMRECISQKIDFLIIHSGQHYSYNLDKVFFDQLKLPEPDYKLEVGSADSPSKQTGRILEKSGEVLQREKPNIVLVQGDTNTVLAGAISAVKCNIDVGHVEAGLRSFDRTMPEETNRIIADHCSKYLFAPTATSKKLLLAEGIDPRKIFVTGNTIVDAVMQNIEIAKKQMKSDLDKFHLTKGEYALVTVHRQENVDSLARFSSIIKGLKEVAEKLELKVILPLHPRSRKMIKTFSLHVPASIDIVEPLDYLTFLNLISSAKVAITDSGGVQEEACILRTPCVTIRDNTERPETVEVGANIIAGIDSKKIVMSVSNMLDIDRRWKNPFGDGKAAAKIIDTLR